MADNPYGNDDFTAAPIDTSKLRSNYQSTLEVGNDTQAECDVQAARNDFQRTQKLDKSKINEIASLVNKSDTL